MVSYVKWLCQGAPWVGQLISVSHAVLLCPCFCSMPNRA